jgi:hypothetical protein
MDAKEVLVMRILGLGVVWACSMAALNVIPPVFFGFNVSYQVYPFLVSAYYLVWLGILLLVFPNTTRAVFVDHSLSSFGLLSFFMAGIVLLYGYVFPAIQSQLPASIHAVDFLVGGPGYVLTKIIEILFQQVLIVALILSIASYKNDVLFVAGVYAALFGVAHLALVPKLGVPLTILFFGLALLSAVVFPYLIMKVRNGFVFSYMVHWVAYIAITFVILLFFHA